MTKDTVFHYTTVESALKIIDSGKIFASHIRFLNDSLEFDFARDMAVSVINNRADEELKYVQGLEPRPFENGAVLVDAITQPLEKLSPIYVACFTKPGDDYARLHGVLSLWRGYGSRGVALVFDQEQLVKATAADREVARYADIWHRSVAYMRPGQRPTGPTKRLFSNLADLTPWAISVDAKSAGLVYPLDRIKSAPIDHLDDIVGVFCFIKHASFKEEAEFRIAAAAIVDTHPRSLLPVKEVRARYANGAVVPYIELPFCTPETSALKGILVGPSAHQERIASSLREYFRIKKMAIQVSCSEIPFVTV
ncbi:DUF2971 domain-containing protein [Devosia sp. FKR38]|uniref:DUF2971 domain-containing protein n=1 Tax=Devosia sp. FKR38 TaxID=2562312 RepID=UPI0010C13746|nr:DUF2971 domain-containing protein [Devosia sp. FKR38]